LLFVLIIFSTALHVSDAVIGFAVNPQYQYQPTKTKVVHGDV